MSQLSQHKSDDLIGIGTRQMPGSFVRHCKDPQSFGTIVAKVGDQSEVLWSKQPVIPTPLPSNPPSMPRAMRSVWTVEEAKALFEGDFGYVTKNSGKVVYHGEETYGPGSFTHGEVEELVRNGARLTFHQDGTIDVIRSEPTLPPHVNEEDVHVHRRRY